ncbi:MAG: YraN family protein [Bacteroidales bacterium]|nr:YraN family protein [Bacteroidales bacterium]MDZ4205222.1 YraN family protein [Bacteroidales bacterium]
MAEHNELGKSGEQIAKGYFISKGYKILETNWRSGRYEIDLIARDKDQLVIVEVKTRTTNVMMEPEAAVTKDKQRMLIRAANAYVQRFNIASEVRFDIISIIIAKEEHRITHIPDAFYPTLF